MLYMGFRRLLGVGASFTLSCLSLTNISIFFVYTQLSRVGVWIGYPYTSDIEILRLNSNHLNKNQSNHTNIFSPCRVRYFKSWCYNESYRPKWLTIAISAHKGLRSSTFIRVVAVRARSQDSTFLKGFSRNTVPLSVHALDLIVKAR